MKINYAITTIMISEESSLEYLSYCQQPRYIDINLLKRGNLIKRWHLLMDLCRHNYKHDQYLPIDPSINMSNDYLLNTIKINFDMNLSNKV